MSRVKVFAAAVIGLAGFTDAIIFAIIIPIIPFIVHDLNADEALIGVLLALYGLGVILGSVFFGTMSIRKASVSKKSQMIWALVASFAATAPFAFGNSIWVLGVARVLQGFACNGAWVIGLSLMADYYQDDQKNMGKAMNAIEIGYVSGQLLGPPIGGYLFTLNYYAPFAFCGALIVLDLVGRLLLPDPVKLHVTEETQDNPSKESEIQVKDIFKFKALWLVLFLAAALYTAFNGIEPTLPLYLQATFGFDSAQIGLMWMSLVLPQIASSFVGAHLFDTYGMKTSFTVGYVTACVALFLVAIPGPKNIAWTACVLVFTGIGLGLGIAPIAPSIAASVPLKYATIGYCLMMVVFATGMVAGPIMASFMYQSIGWSYQMLVFGCILTVSTVLVAWLPKGLQENKTG